MEIKEAVMILRRHNEWRRYQGPIGEGPEMEDPKEFGIAIDIVCDYIENKSLRKE